MTTLPLLIFLINSIALGIGLAMDAFSVSLANGLHEPEMGRGRMNLVAGTYAFFQFAMPLIGWICVRGIASAFTAFQVAIPWIALVLLLFLGIKMLVEGIRVRRDGMECEHCLKRECGGCEHDRTDEHRRLSLPMLLLQGLATSIDALSVGFTIASYGMTEAFGACLIISAVTFFICIAGLIIGRTLGTRLEWKASVLGGIILIAIGIEVFVSAL
ncbi:MAG: manganese efflux pump [Lachnospiraceae bacterium]|nr:manganese efflux pump [Lachnospiraceae bacterium]